MLEINVPKVEFFDERSNSFVKSEGAILMLEHSLVSLSKWESLHGKPFLDGSSRTDEETQSYIACMNVAPVPSLDVYKRLSNEDVKTISEYIDSKQSATWFKEDPSQRPSHEIITSEVIYYWMTAHDIPFETQYWHLNRLLTLIKVCNEKNKPPAKSKMGTREQAASRRMLNAQRKAELGTTG